MTTITVPSRLLPCVLAAALVFVAGAAMAQSTPPPKPDRPDTEQEKPPPLTKRDRTPKAPPKPILMISSDVDCTLQIDGVFAAELQKDVVEQLEISPGEHLLQAFASGVERGPTWKEAIKAPDTGTTVATIELYDLIVEWREEMVNAERFEDSREIVLDRESGLAWTKNVSHSMRFDGANDYCRQLSTGNLSRWRVPTLNELSALYYPDHPSPTQEPCRGEASGGLFFRSKAEIEVMPRMIFEPFEHNSVCSIWVVGQDDRVSCTFLGEFNCAKEKKKHEASTFCVTNAAPR